MLIIIRFINHCQFKPISFCFPNIFNKATPETKEYCNNEIRVIKFCYFTCIDGCHHCCYLHHFYYHYRHHQNPYELHYFVLSMTSVRRQALFYTVSHEISPTSSGYYSQKRKGKQYS